MSESESKVISQIAIGVYLLQVNPRHRLDPALRDSSKYIGYPDLRLIRTAFELIPSSSPADDRTGGRLFDRPLRRFTFNAANLPTLSGLGECLTAISR